MMKFAGGYNIMPEGQPSAEIAKHAKVDTLHLPLFSRRFHFTDLKVQHGDVVQQGQVLAQDPDNHDVPLLAPTGGTVDLEALEYHVTLENLSTGDEPAPDTAAPSGPEAMRQVLLRLGVWSSMTVVGTGLLPDPKAEPRSLIIPITRLEPFFPSPDAYLEGNIERFAAGLGKIQDALDEPSIYLVILASMPGITRQLWQTVKDRCGWARFVEIEETYPADNPALVAQLQELDPQTTWSMDAQAVLGAEAALGGNKPFIRRVVSVGGPVVKEPCHYEVPVGYPLTALVTGTNAHEQVRILDGGVLTGREISVEQKGLDLECTALTALQENTEREVLAFVQAGYSKQSFSRAFASALRPLFREKHTTALRGEARPCVFCGYCESVCPAGIIPHVIYRYLTNDRLEDALRVDFLKCVECGLCSYVCLSKIEHLHVFLEEKAKLATESESR